MIFIGLQPAASDIHSVDRGPSQARGVRYAQQEGTIGDVAHLPLVYGYGQTGGTSIDDAGVDAVHDGQAGDLPFSLLLQESSVRSHRVVSHALLDEILIEIVAFRSVDAVHILT